MSASESSPPGPPTDGSPGSGEDPSTAELRARLRQQEAVAELGEAGLRRASLQALFDRATAMLGELLEADLTKVLEWHPEVGVLLLKSGNGWREGLVGSATEPDGYGSPGGYTMLTERPVVVEDLAAETRFTPSELLREHGAVSGMTVVIQGPEGPYGVLAAFTRHSHTFSRHDVHFLQAVANVLAASLQRADTEERLRQSETGFRETFSHAGVGIAIMDIDGRLLEVNPAFAGIVGYDAGGLVEQGVSVADLTHPEDREETAAALEKLRSGEVPAVTLEKRYRREDGRTVWVQATDTSVPDREGRPKRVIGIIEDITRRREAQDALAEADRRRDVFLATLGHELRNPLTPIATTAEYLEDNCERVDPPRLREAAATISRQSAHLARITEDLLDLNRVKTGRISLRDEELDLRQVAQQAVESVAAEAERKGQRLEVELPDQPAGVRGDPVRLVQVLGNLLDNAVKYTPEEGTVRLNVSARDDQAEVVVQDTGQGIAPEHLPHLFEIFERGQPDQLACQGLGLGLSLVRNLVELHGGEVKATSHGSGQGSEFRVRLPAVGLSEEASGEEAGASPEGSGVVLLVEDNPDVASSLGFLLEVLGYEWRHAATGEQAFELAPSVRPALALIDIGLPDQSGFEVARRLREQLGATPLVALSGHPPSQFPDQPTDVFDDYLVKPPTADSLRHILARIGGG
ncbi:ATP-binding protein [Thiohalorhabdus denitrificans]|uniref:histidine kinase n=1 Tax=Thiohalorhabdus denitrificans TaxID=381306 RepID=A0A1G5G6Q3_9GAMM|nr:ATP-binding protein [Thiohalorhabdus denitrificans]SCY47154.1 PAS domain S-box-containing protein [Thiohalorhabdus denitrificans]